MELEHRRGDIYNMNMENVSPLCPSIYRKIIKCLVVMALKKARQASTMEIARALPSSSPKCPFPPWGQTPPHPCHCSDPLHSLLTGTPFESIHLPWSCSPTMLQATSVCPQEDWSSFPASIMTPPTHSLSATSVSFLNPNLIILLPTKDPLMFLHFS